MRWLKAGSLHLRLPYPTAAEVEAIDLALDSLTAREAWELEQIKNRKGTP